MLIFRLLARLRHRRRAWLRPPRRFGLARRPGARLRTLGAIACVTAVVATIAIGAFVAGAATARPLPPGTSGPASGAPSPLRLDQALAHGIEAVTGGRLTADVLTLTVVAGVVMTCLRILVLGALAYWSGGPVEVRRIVNATGDASLDTGPLEVTFREYLSLPRLYQVTTLPGDPEPDRIIEVFRSAPESKGWRGLLAAAYAYVIPTRAFVVSVTLRHRPGRRGCGAAAQVRRLTGPIIELETEWSSSYGRALQRAAFAVGAHILPQTRACRAAPWSDWYRCILPAGLFRSYQRAKIMVRERRYDEALALYHDVLLQDPNNMAMRYDLAQLYERLQLYPDALHTYLALMEEIFPPLHHGRGKPWWAPWRRHPRVRHSSPTWWPAVRADPFSIRYRFVVVLGQSAVQARELLAPDWHELTRWLTRPAGVATAEDLEERPWRVVELVELRRDIAAQLQELYWPVLGPELARAAGEHGRTVPHLREVLRVGPDGDAAVPAREDDALWLQLVLLLCARTEAVSLRQDFLTVGGGRRRRSRRSLTATALRVSELISRHRLEGVLRELAQTVDRDGLDGKPGPGVEDVRRELELAGYHENRSTSWLEHYNAACLYAFFLPEVRDPDAPCDQSPPQGRAYAERAVSCLERAMYCGEEVSFVTSKRYWLLAGDPDLARLRRYDCFRAFEARFYVHPLPATDKIGRYELYVYLRRWVEAGARAIARQWAERSAVAEPSAAELERWWDQEERAWQQAVRLGRFYRQWQTRSSLIHDMRSWTDAFGLDDLHVPYPDVARHSTRPRLADFDLVNAQMTRTEEMLDALGRCGRLSGEPSTAGDACLAGPPRLEALVGGNTTDWSGYVSWLACTPDPPSPARAQLAAVARARAALWTGVRQWAKAPGAGAKDAFRRAVLALPPPPPVIVDLRDDDAAAGHEPHRPDWGRWPSRSR